VISYSQHCTLAGYVQDAQSGERLINAYINILNTRTGCVTNEQGYFSLVVDKGMVTLKVSYIGHSPDTFHMEVKKDTFIVFHLQPSNSLQEVTVTGRYVPQSYNAIKVEMSDMAKLPVLGGEADLMKTM